MFSSEKVPSTNVYNYALYGFFIPTTSAYRLGVDCANSVSVLSIDSLLLLRKSWTVIDNTVPSVEIKWCWLENFPVDISFICKVASIFVSL